MEDEDVTPILKRMIEISALPMKAVETSFACDSSGFSGSRFDRWYDHKFRRHCIKRHVGQGPHFLRRQNERRHGGRDRRQGCGDCVQLPPMLETTAAELHRP